MKGILFKEDMFNAVIHEAKTQTRRIVVSEKPRYKVGEKVFLKEPYFLIGDNVYYKFNYDQNHSWKNKMFMHEKYARYYIEITDVRSELLQDISRKDIRAEGLCLPISPRFTPKGKMSELHCEYRDLWERINGRGSWDNNPKVWVYEFKLVK